MAKCCKSLYSPAMIYINKIVIAFRRGLVGKAEALNLISKKMGCSLEKADEILSRRI